MMRQRILFSSATCLVLTVVSAGRLLAEKPPCATNYSTDGTSSETFILTSQTPQSVAQRLPHLLVKAGVTMQWAEPDKGIIKAEKLDVRAETVGEATRVTFRSSHQPAADRETLCRYASLVGNPPIAKAPPLAQDSILIARMKDDLLKKHQIVQPGPGRGLNNATFSALSDFLDFAVTSVKTSSGRQEYSVSMLLPRSACGIASEDLDDASTGLNGRTAAPRTKPVRVTALLVYEGEGAASHLTDASIVSIESTK
jgi:hypothetical protein